MRFLYFFLFLTVSLSSCIGSEPIQYVNLESYGAKGDGVHNDASALNRCIKEGRNVELLPNKTYLLGSPIAAIESDTFCIKGNGSSIVIPKTYPVTSSCAIFYLSHRHNPKLFKVEDVDMVCQLEKKKTVPAGDTYVFLSKNCDKVEFKKLSFRCTGKYNNVTFLRSEGGDLLMDSCNVVMNTFSDVGGIFWLMNKFKTQSNVNIKNSYFEYESKDECMCFSSSADTKVDKAYIKVSVDNCKYKTLAQSKSSGFVIVYAKKNDAYSDIDVKYNKCSFESRGKYLRYIQTYQCGKDSLCDYGKFRTEYKDCNFDFHMDRDNADDERGLLSLVYLKSNNMNKSNVGYVFRDCDFRLRGIHPIVGDKDSNRKGYYEFHNCVINSDDRAFQKKYNVLTGDVSLLLKDCKVVSNDEFLNHETVDMTKCSFRHPNGRTKSVKIKRKGQK
ncbi:MAG: hypothetical protein IKN77_04635 [Paludibacteraceae bacterium]|nr:hypothetical protein [Paludibacteraceae bacterium]